MSPDATDRDEDLPELLDDLEATLAELRAGLREGTGRDRPESPARRTGPDRPRRDPDLPRPPSVSELLRFTEQYTLPTLISTLEATIRALELLRGTLRVIDPDRSAFEGSSGRSGASTASRLGSGAAGVGREAISGVERALAELEAALAETNVPEDRASSELLGEARDLSAEVRERLEAARGTADRSGRRRTGGFGRSTGADSDTRSDGVEIEVTGDEDDTGAAEDGRTREGRPEVDVEAELASIRHEVRGDDPEPIDGSADSADETPDAADGTAGSESGDGGTAAEGTAESTDAAERGERSGDGGSGRGGEGEAQ